MPLQLPDSGDVYAPWAQPKKPGLDTPPRGVEPQPGVPVVPPGGDAGSYLLPGESTTPLTPPTAEVHPPGSPGPGPAPAGPSTPTFTPFQGGVVGAPLQFNPFDAWAREAARVALIQWGEPALASMAGLGQDPQDQSFARANYLGGGSQFARLEKQRDLARRAVINRLAAHGILNSGDLGHGLSEAETGYANTLQDARASLLRYLSGLFSQTATGKVQTLQELANQWLNPAGAS